MESGTATVTIHRPSLTSEIVDPGRWVSIEDWDDAVAAMARPSVFLTRAWVSAWWHHVGSSSRQPVLIRVSDVDDRTVGLAPFTIERRGPAGRVRCLGLVGDTLVGSEYLGAAAVAGFEEAVAAEAVATLDRSGARWDIALLAGGRDGDPAAAALTARLRAGAGRSDSTSEPCVAVICPDTVEDWWSTLGSSFRRTLRQRRRRLERDHQVAYRVVEDGGEVLPALDQLFAMHQTRWRAMGRPGSFADARMRSFYAELAPAFLAAGRLRFWLLEVDGVVRAAQFGFAHAGTLHSLQEAYDSEWQAPGVNGLGVVLRLHAMESAMEEGLTGYDFLGGDQDHKQRWGTTEHRVTTTRLARPGSAGRLAWRATFGVNDARDAVMGRVPIPLKRRVRGYLVGRA